MFSPMGKKKILLEQRYTSTKSPSPSPTKERALSISSALSMSEVDSQEGASFKRPRSSKHTNRTGDSIASTSNLEKALSDPGTLGIVMNKIMESTVRYRPEKDAVILKAFQSKNIEYEKFRAYLYSAFWLGFEDEEFKTFLSYFDPCNDGILNGYDFMIAFTRLGGIRKSRASALVREKHDLYVQQQKEEQERKQLEQEKKMELAADFEFNEEVRRRAVMKLKDAASKFDPKHPSCGSPDAFNVNYMKPAVFKEMLKLTFNLKVDRAELGAILKEFDPNIDKKRDAEQGVSALDALTADGTNSLSDASSEVGFGNIGEAGESTMDSATMGESKGVGKKRDISAAAAAVSVVGGGGATLIKASEFLRFFLRLGIKLREDATRAQRQKQIEMNIAASEEQERKLTEAAAKMNMDVDYNFPVAAEESAQEKLRVASKKYDRNAPGAVALDGFECDSLDPGQFKDLIRRVFGIVLTAAELGYVVKRYDTKKIGRVHCKNFLTEFLRMGQEQRYKTHVDQLEEQRRLNQEAEAAHQQKILEVQTSETVKISDRFNEKHLQSALEKFTEASIRYDKVRGVSLISFEPAVLTPLEFKKALKRTFNVRLTAPEMGAAVEYFDKNGSNTVHCQTFLSTFTLLGAAKKGEVRSMQLQKQREDWRLRKEEHDRKALDVSKKTLYNVDFDCDDVDKEIALEKITAAAMKYDPGHPAALGLDGFERKTMNGAEFKELVRRTFQLKLSAKEVGAVFDLFNCTGTEINCKEFLQYFLQLGIAERAKVEKAQRMKQRRDDEEREKEHQRKIEELATRQTFTVNFNFAEADKTSIMEKLDKASEGFDKSHPAAPSLEAFEVALMPPGLFRENLKRVFNVLATPEEIGVLMQEFDKGKIGKIDSKNFMNKFTARGKKIRDDKRRKFLDDTRAAQKEAKLEEERKLAAMWEKAELDVDYNTTTDDLRSAVEKMTAASFKYDKSHPSAPSLAGFSGGPIKPGIFRELVRRAFHIWFEPKELGAVVKKFKHEKLENMVDGKVFLIAFMKLGYDARARTKSYTLQKQRHDEMQRRQEEELKLLQAAQRVVLDLDPDFGEADLQSAMKKMTKAAALYDKNSPGCVSLEAFDSAFLTPGMFRETAKRTFNVVFEPKELSAVMSLYDNGKGNLDCQKFLVAFIRIGAEEREKAKSIQLEKQRQDDFMRKSDHDRKMKDLESKLVMNLDYKYSDAQRDSAFEKLVHFAKKYDKNHPGAMSLDGFEQKVMKPHVFREMIKRTFGVVLQVPHELAAVMHYFDPKKIGVINSRKFLIYFLKLGIAEREADHRKSMDKLRSDAAFREKEHQDKLVAQWAKMELTLTSDFTEDERESALAKLSDAAFKFDPASPGPMGLTAFNGKTMSPAVFKEMLRRSFNMKVTQGELAALIAEFDHDGTNTQINCGEFMVRFTQLGFDRRSAMRAEQLHRQRTMDKIAAEEAAAKKIAADAKMEANLGMDFDGDDFNAVLEKIRVLASNYDRTHAAAPSLKGFVGPNMKPVEFKDMLMRTFKVQVNEKQLGALVSIFGVEKDPAQVSVRDKHSTEGVRIDNMEFLKYFNKIQREEQAKRHRERIARERNLVIQEKEHQLQLAQQKRHEELQMLIFSPDDELTLLDKLRQAAQNYAVDSAVYGDTIQGFKGPALPPDKFRELFSQVFAIKLTFPEVGVLLSILDLGGIGTLDGAKFLNWFYKLSRQEERFMLGESADPVTLATLKQASSTPTRANTATTITSSSSNALVRTGTRGTTATTTNAANGGRSQKHNITQSWDTRSSADMAVTAGTAGASKPISNSGSRSAKPVHISSKYILKFDEDEAYRSSQQQQHQNNSHTFTESTINKHWILPTITATASRGGNNSNSGSMGPAGFGSMAFSLEDDELEAGEAARQHLHDVFTLDLQASQSLEDLGAAGSFTSSVFLDDLKPADHSPHGHQESQLGHSLGVPLSRSGNQENNRRIVKQASMGKMEYGAAVVDPASSSSNAHDNSNNRNPRKHLRTAPAKQLGGKARARRGVGNAAAAAAAGMSMNSPQQLAPLSSAELVGSTMMASPLSSMALTVADSSSTSMDDAKFLQNLFSDDSPYAQTLKVPARYPTSTSKTQKQPLVQLQMANRHFHDSPIALKKKHLQQHPVYQPSTAHHNEEAAAASATADAAATAGIGALRSATAGKNIIEVAAFIPSTLPVAPPSPAKSTNNVKRVGTASTAAGSKHPPASQQGKAEPASSEQQQQQQQQQQSSADTGTTTDPGVGDTGSKVPATTTTTGASTSTSKYAIPLPKRSKEDEGSGFFFPALLTSAPGQLGDGGGGDANGQEEEEEEEGEEEDDIYSVMKKKKDKAKEKDKHRGKKLRIPGVPDIDAVGVSEHQKLDDQSFLQSILDNPLPQQQQQ